MNDETVASIGGEYRRYRRVLELTLEQISDEDFFRAPDAVTNPIAVIVGHLAGNLRSRFTDFLTTDGEKPWRERDAEFETPDVERGALLARLDEAWDMLAAALDEVTEKDALGATITIREQPLSVVEALHRSLAHVAYHVGQVVLIARSALGEDWKTLSIPKGGSVAYAAHPTLEKGPDGRR